MAKRDIRRCIVSSTCIVFIFKPTVLSRDGCAVEGSNVRPARYQRAALAAELTARGFVGRRSTGAGSRINSGCGGRGASRRERAAGLGRLGFSSRDHAAWGESFSPGGTPGRKGGELIRDGASRNDNRRTSAWLSSRVECCTKGSAWLSLKTPADCRRKTNIVGDHAKCKGKIFIGRVR